MRQADRTSTLRESHASPRFQHGPREARPCSHLSLSAQIARHIDQYRDRRDRRGFGPQNVRTEAEARARSSTRARSGRARLRGRHDQPFRAPTRVRRFARFGHRSIRSTRSVAATAVTGPSSRGRRAVGDHEPGMTDEIGEVGDRRDLRKPGPARLRRGLACVVRSRSTARSACAASQRTTQRCGANRRDPRDTELGAARDDGVEPPAFVSATASATLGTELRLDVTRSLRARERELARARRRRSRSAASCPEPSAAVTCSPTRKPAHALQMMAVVAGDLDRVVERSTNVCAAASSAAGPRTAARVTLEGRPDAREQALVRRGDLLAAELARAARAARPARVEVGRHVAR